MTSKSQLQNKIQELEAELQSFKSQLNNYQEITLETAKVGDVLKDGSTILQKENGLALLVAPESTEVTCSWSPEFPEVYAKLKEQGFNPSQWFVPTKEQLQLAYKKLENQFSPTRYWSSTVFNAASAYRVGFNCGNALSVNKAYTLFVRAFRCVTY